MTTPTHPLSHQEAWNLLPWLANGSLEGSELDALLDHLKSCPVCLDELRYLPELRAAFEGHLESPDSTDDGREGFERLMERIVNESDPPRATFRGGGLSAVPTWARWAAAVQAAVVLLVAGWSGRALWAPSPQPVAQEFRTLSSGSAAVETNAQTVPSQIRVVFSEAAPIGEVSQLLRRHSLDVVEGPNSMGAFVVQDSALPSAAAGRHLQSLLSELRAEELVDFAEPLQRPEPRQ